MSHKYEIVVSDGRTDRILRAPIDAESKRHAMSLGKLHCREGEAPIDAKKVRA